MKLKMAGRPTGAAARPSGSQPVRPRSDHAAGAVVGIMGWLALLAVMAGLVAATLEGQRRLVAVRAAVAPAVAQIQAGVEPRRAELLQEREGLTQKINDLVKRQEDLLPRVQTAERSIRELESQITGLEHAKGKLAETVGALQEDQSLTGEGVAALQAKLQGLERTRDRLREDYRTRFAALRAAFEMAKDAPDAAALRQFYASHRQTAFGPAAGYHAAEKLFATKHSSDALRLYREVVRSYPGSVYEEPCKTRVVQIEAGAKYSEPSAPVTFEAYLPEAGVSSQAKPEPAATPAAADAAAEPATP